MSANTLRSLIFSVIAGAIAGIIYESIYFLTNNHHVRGGFVEAAIIGAVTFLIAFVINLIFSQIYRNRA